ncbi:MULTISPECIES: efflux RND transporter periplasmic adaptor subunit [Burkholderia]|uniref:Membrane fusion component of tripartite multidrug resistance system n=1 Tax=Burkholderia singularis TaxID=1503053 RepID=A0A238H281_9BURK|nr:MULTISPECIES: efflux RND transporter periplasmic adaptor subunit [Burkholderia]SMF99356.1 Membrane fusion component of tripartite multidrug resistance system [Burkholderia singularis]
MSDTTQAQTVEQRTVQRKKRLTVIAVAVLIAGGAWFAWDALSNGAARTTDDAYVGGRVVQITPQVSGTVTRILADNTDRVTAGAPLVEIDSADARIELSAAEAQLAQAVRAVRGMYAADARYDADVKLRRAELDKAQADLAARRAIASAGAVTGEDVRHAEVAVRAAQAALDSAQQQLVQARAQIDGSTIESHPAVQSAAQRVRAAELALARSVVLAPVSGMVAQRAVQLGKRIAPGDKLMSVVPLNHLWVDANFKEVQLKGVCPGQKATITADIYGKSVKYHGVVADIEAGTGASFALLPAQNATGNWIKVVQRVPVRVLIDPKDLAAHPLRIGMSVEAEVIADKCDPAAAAARHPQVDDAAAIYAAQQAQAEVRVREIIAANMGAK